MSPGPNVGDGEVSRMRMGVFDKKPAKDTKAQASESIIVSDLQERKSVLPQGSSFDLVSGPVLSANSRAAESELRVARLRAEAQSKNWLPTIGPSISLSSLGEVLTSLVIDAVIFDNGKKKAEREFARADVEVAAVSLAIDTNDRVNTALGLYVKGQEAREKAGLYERAVKDMKHFEYVMNERVKGGVSDLSDLSVIRHKLAKVQASHAASVEAASAAVAELNAMSIKKLGGVTGLSDFSVGRHDAQPLTVMLAEAEKTRTVAGAKIDRAGFLPGLKASATVTKTGTSGGLELAPENGIGLGTAANLKAIKAAEEAAGRRVSQATEEANRRLAKHEARLAALSRQVGEASTLANQAKSNLDLFQQQYEAGQRQVMDVVGVYETWVSQEETRVGLKYEMALARIEIAREQGLLADGSDI
ncbi:TolC family protein [Alisedimentitalea sp. MJ-SS2]|uniref:TolC family protein n=1 Tax=Aliisedimentitalea sp. MJ-SS2 TaxID=3049795 RepID=UPI0029137CC3|nr:TolC family protein [Alisedimentitalea sp. MJ-SS2]MDU8927484.1 TolC family protein [Alisedimentitalea sp. MJ-SS2]